MKVTLVFVSLLFPVLAQAGAISGGGGKGVVCTDKTTGAVTVELLDLWEARTLFDQQVVAPTGNLAADVDAALVRLKESYRLEGSGAIDDTGQIYVNQDYVLARLRQNADQFLKPNPNLKHLRGDTLKQTDDSFELAQPNDCSVEQLVNYQVNHKILMNQDLVEKMDESSYAALIVHEALYTLLRNLAEEPNSVRTRRAVGYVFAGKTFSLNLPKPSPTVLVCDDRHGLNHGNTVVLYIQGQNSQGNPHLYFYPLWIGGSPLMGAINPASELTLSHDAPELGMFSLGHCSPGESYVKTGWAADGPVEFDRVVDISYACEKGQFSATLTTSMPGQNTIEKSQLDCSLHNYPNDGGK